MFYPFLYVLLLLCSTLLCRAQAYELHVGSKKFTESVLLGEIITQLVQSDGGQAVHRKELGGTRILWNALLKGEIDVYPEYTGTIAQELLGGKSLSEEDMRRELAKQGIRMSRSLGFNDTYAIGMKEEVAQRLGMYTIADVTVHPDLMFGVSNEFLDRADGWPGLKDRYHLSQPIRGLDHDLAYRALEQNEIQLTDLYSTDAEIAYYKLRVLNDTLHYFPEYKAVLLYRADLEQKAPGLVHSFLRLEGSIDESLMIHMNADAKLSKISEHSVAAHFLKKKFSTETILQEESLSRRLLRTSGEHLALVGTSLLAAILLSIPLGIVAFRFRRTGRLILAIAGILQTIPSLALLVFMIPFLGIGGLPAIVALFLYSLLPIIRNTHAGLMDIPPHIRESAQALGLPFMARLRLIELPMAGRSILAGIKTAAVVNVGTATLGALIGAGGYGQPILTGIRLDNTALILEGAIPAAVLALLVQWFFDVMERFVAPHTQQLHPT